jgi:hypothetical protein
MTDPLRRQVPTDNQVRTGKEPVASSRRLYAAQHDCKPQQLRTGYGWAR